MKRAPSRQSRSCLSKIAPPDDCYIGINIRAFLVLLQDKSDADDYKAFPAVNIAD